MRLRIVRVCVAAALLLGCLTVSGSAAADANTQTLVLREPHRGATAHFVDAPPRSKRFEGFPSRFSPGDELIFTNPLELGGRIVGRIRVLCTATQGASVADEIKAGFLCTILAKLPAGTITMVGPLDEPGNRNGRVGAVVGGTGSYAGARGSFDDEEGRSFDTNTITLLE